MDGGGTGVGGGGQPGGGALQGGMLPHDWDGGGGPRIPKPAHTTEIDQYQYLVLCTTLQRKEANSIYEKEIIQYKTDLLT